MTMVQDTVIARFVEPKGDILNDNDSGVDYLGNTVYAEALAKRIQHVNTPITIGILAKWGSGKTFLVNQVQSLLRKYQRQKNSLDKISQPTRNFWRSRCCCRTIFLFFLISVIVSSIIFALFPDLLLFGVPQDNLNLLNMTSSNKSMMSLKNVSQNNLNLLNMTLLNQSLTSPKILGKYYYHHGENTASDVSEDNNASNYDHLRNITRYIAIGILSFAMVFVFIVICGNNNCWSGTFFRNFKLVCYVAFTKIPIKTSKSSIVRETVSDDQVFEITSNSEEIVEKSLKPLRYIFVNFNAWEYAGSDSLWAGIITNLSDAIESEFGSVMSRLFRMLHPELIQRDIKTKEIISTILFVKIGTDLSRNEALDILKEYGDVTYFKEYRTWRKDCKKRTSVNNNNTLEWYVVEYSNHKEAKLAKEYLELEDIEIEYSDPFKNYKTAQNRRDRNENHIEMQDLNTIPPEDKELLNRQKNSTKNKAKSRKPNKLSFCSHFLRHPKTTCCFPDLFWWILLLFSGVSLPVVTYVLADTLDLNVFKKYPRAVPVVVQIFAWLPSTLAVFVVVFKLIWAMLHSQRNRINKALDGAKGNMGSELGFMNKVKTEVEIISKLIKCVEFSHNKKYKVVITIDDLDRLSPNKVKSVLEAVSILLSDCSSPFICLVALDSRVAVKCIEQEMSPSLLKANISGYEYLKKIINLPFCLPEIENKNKKTFITGLIDQSDKTKKMRIPNPYKNQEEANLLTEDDQKTRRAESRRSSIFPSRRNSAVVESRRNSFRETNLSDVGTTFVDNKMENPVNSLAIKKTGDVVDSGPIKADDNVELKPKYQRRNNPLSHETFIFECRKYMRNNKMVVRHINGNPRNMKRIFNVLSLTATIINCSENQKLKSRNIKLMAMSSLCDEVNEIRSNGPHLNLNQQMVSNNINDERNIRNVGLAEDLVTWVVLTDQWPYRMSYLLQIIEDADQKRGNTENISDNESLFEIYKTFVLPEIEKLKKLEEDKSLLFLDSNPENLFNFLQELSTIAPYMNKSRVKLLKKYTINLDYSLKQTITFQRDNIGLKDNDEESNCASDNLSTTDLCSPNKSLNNNKQFKSTPFIHISSDIGHSTLGKKRKRSRSAIQKRIERRKRSPSRNRSLKSPRILHSWGYMSCDEV